MKKIILLFIFLNFSKNKLNFLFIDTQIFQIKFQTSFENFILFYFSFINNLFSN